ncbi:MAG: hypothetical protein HC769_07020 [Cyanobacteria bacterium CRU_2_1]|nr:hypothetical protein [Cyanobacteria bacterium CRU_2_1]
MHDRSQAKFTGILVQKLEFESFLRLLSLAVSDACCREPNQTLYGGIVCI